MNTIQLSPEHIAGLTPLSITVLNNINNEPSHAKQIELLKRHLKATLVPKRSIVDVIKNLRTVSTLDNVCLQGIIDLLVGESHTSFIDYLNINREQSNKPLNVTIPATYKPTTISNELAVIISKKGIETAFVITIILRKLKY